MDRKNQMEQVFYFSLVWLLLSAIYLFLYLKFDPSNFTLNNQTVSLLILALISLLFIPFQAAFEEVLFRGYLMQGFAALVKNRWFPLIMTSVLFGLMHAFNPEGKGVWIFYYDATVYSFRIDFRHYYYT